MIFRHGKIARLPSQIREELNRRLYNGELSPELLPWLNELPAVKEVLTKFFADAPINRQNLTEWRHGGYQDWLRQQEHELRIQRITEEGDQLKGLEGKSDLFENAARIAIAELMAEIDSLSGMEGQERWDRLRTLTRELVRLQNGYNRSRWADLAWTRWNDRFLSSDDYIEPSEEADNEKTVLVEAEVEPQQIQNEPTITSPTPSPSTPVKVDQTESSGRGESPAPPEPTLAPQQPQPTNILTPTIIPIDATAHFLRQAAHRKVINE